MPQTVLTCSVTSCEDPVLSSHGHGTLESMLTLESAQLEVKSQFYSFSSLSLPPKASIPR